MRFTFEEDIAFEETLAAERYEQGWQDGYRTYNRGFSSYFRCLNKPVPMVIDCHGNQVTAGDLDFARGHIDGFMKAADDSHE